MPRGLGKTRIRVLQDMFDKIKRQASDKTGIFTSEEGIVYIFQYDCGIPYAQAITNLAFLELAGYIERIYSGKKITGVKLLRDTWEGAKTLKQRKKKEEKKKTIDVPPLRIEKPVAPPVQVPTAPKAPPQATRYVFLVDWNNIELSAPSTESVIQTLINLEDTLVAQDGSIEAKFVFVPDHRIERARKLATLYRYFMVVCPRTGRSDNGSGKDVWKDTDTVDARISNLGNLVSLFAGPLITDFVLVSGDRDYMDFVQYAKNHGKKITIASYHTSLSTALERAADNVIIL